MRKFFPHFVRTTKNIFQSFLLLFKKEYIFFLSIFFLQSVSLFAANIATLSFNKQTENEICLRITNEAKQNELGLSANYVQMNQIGNSDYFVYTNEKIQHFQYRNLKYEGEKNYVFAAYQPYSGNCPLDINAGEGALIRTSAILFESKYADDNFYFDLPLLAGSFPRVIPKDEIIIPDIVAKKILGNSLDYNSLIGKTLETTTIMPNYSIKSNYKIRAIVSSNTKLGETLNVLFKEEYVFIPDYNSFQMKGMCFFIGSKDIKENKEMINFILSEYKSTKSSVRFYETGYNASFSFLEYKSPSTFEESEVNVHLNKLLNKLNPTTKTITSCIGFILLLTSLSLLICYILKERKNFKGEKRNYMFFAIWIISCLSLLLNSFLCLVLPIENIIAGTKLLSFSGITSSFMFIYWIILNAIILFLTLSKKNFNDSI